MIEFKSHRVFLALDKVIGDLPVAEPVVHLSRVPEVLVLLSSKLKEVFVLLFFCFVGLAKSEESS